MQHIHDPDGGYLYFLEFDPVATIGYSTFIYHLDIDETNRVRGMMGLAQLPQLERSSSQLLDDMIEARDSRCEAAVAVFSANQRDRLAEAELRSAIGRDADLSVTFLTGNEIRGGLLGRFRVLVVPGGRGSAQGTELGIAGRNAVRRFVSEGGGYVGICAGAYLATVNHDWSLKLVNAATVDGTRYVPGHGSVSAAFRGWGDVSIELVNRGRDLFSGLPCDCRLAHTGGPLFMRANEPSLPDYEPIACFRSELRMHAFQEGTMINTPAIVAARFGRGRVLLFSPHPESSPEHERLLPLAIRACASTGSRVSAARRSASVDPFE